MNDNFLALLVASAALSPVVWKMHQRWQAIKPLKPEHVVWQIEPPSTMASCAQPHVDWLEQHWREQSLQVGRKWFVRARDEQYEQLRTMGWDMREGPAITVSQANDLLALNRSADEDDIALLNFFGVVEDYPNALVVGVRAATFRLDANAMATWAARPATSAQKEGLRFFGLKVPKGIAANEATRLLDEQERLLFTAGRHAEWEKWSRYAVPWALFQSRPTLDRYELKKPTLRVLRKTILDLAATGVTDWHEPDVVAQQLAEQHPELDLRMLKQVDSVIDNDPRAPLGFG